MSYTDFATLSLKSSGMEKSKFESVKVCCFLLRKFYGKENGKQKEFVLSNGVTNIMRQVVFIFRLPQNLTEEQREEISIKVKNATVIDLTFSKKEGTKIVVRKSKWTISSIKADDFFNDLNSLGWISNENFDKVRHSFINTLANRMLYCRHATRWSKDFNEKKHDTLSLSVEDLPKGYYKKYINSYV